MRRLVTLIALCALTPAASAQNPSPTTIASAYGGAIPAACAGPSVDLNQIRQCRCVMQRPLSARSTCGDAIERRNLSQLVAVRADVTPSPVKGGDPITIAVVVENRTTTDLPVVFGDTGPILVRDLSIHDSRGREVSYDGTCGQGFGTTPSNYMVVIAPNGVAQWRLPWTAATRVEDAHCNPAPSRPLASGTYDVSVRVTLPQVGPMIARGTLRVM